MDHLGQLREQGVTVLRGAITQAGIAHARSLVLENRALLRRTRPSPSSGHLACFHRHPELEPLHEVLTGNQAIRQVIAAALDGERACTIGLSDITLNRSQQWHVDLLRGKYRSHLEGIDIWNPVETGVYKVLLYLNDTDSLKVVSGSHRKHVSLDSDETAVPSPQATILPFAIRAGDVVVLDIRCVHRGAEESEYLTGKWDEQPRILVSTVFGGVTRRLTHALEAGNFARFLDWQARWTGTGQPTDMAAAAS